jgi:hypothetical protein
MRLLFGSKLKNTKVKADTILNAIDKLDKLIPKFRKHYDILSEYAHPNSFGTFISFGKLDKENKTFYFGSKSRDKEINGSIFTFLGSIQLTIQINNNIEKYYPKFFQICESSIR